MDEPVDPVEPVHWGARLERVPAMFYTEVDAVPCLVDPAAGRVLVLTPTWAAIWARLDGRAVTAALDVEPSTMMQSDARNLIEVLRRLKAMGAVRDATGPASTDRTERPDDRLAAPAATPGPVTVTLSGSVTRRHGTSRLRIVPASAATATVTLTETAAGDVVVDHRHRWRRRRVEVVSVDRPGADATGQTAVERFAATVEAVTEPTEWSAALIDRLAGLAETATTPASPVLQS